jgi:PAS domain S-box-containing protein
MSSGDNVIAGKHLGFVERFSRTGALIAGASAAVLLCGIGWASLKGHDAGFYGGHVGLLILIVASIAFSALAIVLTLITFHQIDLGRKRAEASANNLDMNQGYLDFALRSHQLGAWALDLRNHTAHRTLLHDQIFGYPTLLPAWTFEMFLDHVVPEDRPEVLRSFQTAIAAESDWSFNCRIRRADGAIRHILAAGTHKRDAEGKAVEIHGLVQDITEGKRVEEVQQEMAALVESADDGILTKSLDGVIRSWNPAAERLLGYRADEIIGHPVTRLLPQDRLEEESMILDKLRRGERVSHFETVRRRRDGSLVDVSLTISPIRDHAGIVVGASKIMRDITERKRAEYEWRRINEDLEQKNQDLDDFVYTASHDLRAPLTGISTVAQWILDDDGSISVESRARLAMILGRIERMKKLLNDIRDYARAGQQSELSVTPLTAAALLADVVATSHVPAGFSIHSDPSLEEVDVNRIPLEQVLHNLLNNAIKHHDRERGIVSVSVDSHGPALRFSVIDDGPGIPESYREAVFEMFKTLKPRDEVEGSGMGLALVRKIVGRLGGKCGIEEACGRGAKIWFDWPRFGRTAGRAK